ncbi:hypothetical protein [Geotalea toluenoxydans]|uniref:hypothetical protein n=1 Tax=Geotalea toluenoxydans TaxID=421624 RepID=UPI000B1F796D|nr:hypothetical protein [Geotalea toluenoxydans]
METFIIKLAVAVLPLIALIGTITITFTLHRRIIAHRPLSYHRTRRSMQRALAVGTMLR